MGDEWHRTALSNFPPTHAPIMVDRPFEHLFLMLIQAQFKAEIHVCNSPVSRYRRVTKILDSISRLQLRAAIRKQQNMSGSSYSRGAMRPRSIWSTPHTKGSGAPRRRIVVSRLRGATKVTLARRDARPCDRACSPLGAPLRRFWAGGRASVSGISSRSVQRCSSQPGRSVWRAGSRASRDPVTSRTARRRSSLHLLGPSPEDALVERGHATRSNNTLRSQ